MAKLTRTTLFPNTSELAGINIKDDSVKEGLRLVKKWADRLTPALESTFRSTYNKIQATTAHNLLSVIHSDSQAASVVRGDVLIGNSTPEWSRIAVGASGEYLRSDGADVGWSAIAAADLSGAPAFDSGVEIGTLTLADGSITDSGGTIDFGNENLETTGIFDVGLVRAIQVHTSQFLQTAAGLYFDNSGTVSLMYLSSNDLIIENIASTKHIKLLTSGSGSVLLGEGRLGVTTDTDLLQLAANALTVNGSLIVDTDTLVVDAVTHRVGIRESSPSYPLHVPWVSGDTTHTAYFGSLNASNNQTAVFAQSYGDTAVYAHSGTKAAIYGYSGVTWGLHAAKGVNVDDVRGVIKIERKVSAEISAGNTGAGLDYYISNAASQEEFTARVAAVMTDATDGSEKSALTFYTRDTDNGGVTEKMRLDYLGNLNINGGLTANGITSSKAGLAFLAEYTSTATGLITTAAGFKHTTTGDMVDGFGAAIAFSIEDDGAVNNIIGRVQAVRDGADTEGKLQFRCGTFGDEIFMTINSSGVVDVPINFTAGTIQADNGFTGSWVNNEGDTVTVVGGIITGVAA